uniref:ATP-dependent zinc metalloprotease FtsH n=1 Tax=candidate division WWE3 bacterium TaxID=2053526 RepID=A0A7C4XI94_UNCKA
MVKTPSLFNNVFFYVFLTVVIFSIVSTFTGSLNPASSNEAKPISEVIKQINQENVQDITVTGSKIEVQLKDGTKFLSSKEEGISFDEILSNNQIDRNKIAGDINVKEDISWLDIISPILSFGLPLLLLFFIFRQMRGASGDIASFGQSRARLFGKDSVVVTFKDVAGAGEAKKELLEIVDFLKNPEKYRKLGARIPKGILLVGSSGVGKTLLAKAIAGEAGVPFFSVAGSEFMEMLVGVGSARARDLFLKAKEAQPSLIFIDEIDAIGRQRGMGIGGGHDEREQTLNQILIEMDGFDPRISVIVIAATNRPDMLDPALIRPGRFDRKITVPMPDLQDREEIIKIHMLGKPIASDVSVAKIAKRTVGFSGADLENMLNEAAILAARENKEQITEPDLEEAALKVTMGSERRTIQTDEERRMVAYHEAGHALVASKMPDMDPVHQISIVARGGSLGHTSLPPQRDRHNETKTRLLSLITTMLGGRAAEEIVFNELTVGASDDIKRATGIATKMVTEFGMSSLGPINYNGHDEYGWLAKEIHTSPKHSDDMTAKIDAEVKKFMEEAYTKAKETLVKYRATLDKVAQALLDHETVRGEEYEMLLNG